MLTVGIYIVAAIVRGWLSTSGYRDVIGEHIGISTPLNSWKRIVEGIHLIDKDIYPYVGDTIHETPLHLWAYYYLVKMFGDYLFIVFVACDLVTSYFLYIYARNYMKYLGENQEKNKESYAEDAKSLLLSETDMTSSPRYVVYAYLCNPYTIFNCAGFSTTVFSNLFMATFLVGLSHNNLLLATLPLAICISQSFYPLVLLSPLFIQLVMNESRSKGIAAIVLTFTFWSLILYLSYLIYGRWDFIENTYGFILTVPDLQPNIGLFWYFFIEMFDHFRDLFIYSFQINATILYLFPLSIRFHKDPILLSQSLLALIAIFKSYPSVGDVGFVMSLYPCWAHLFDHIQQGFLVTCCFLVTTGLGPTVWYLWIYSGSANANFYFGVTLGFATAQIFLITDVLFAHTKREFALRYGKSYKLNDKVAKLTLD